VACTQTRISYNWLLVSWLSFQLWLALRRGSVTMTGRRVAISAVLWLALRRGSVTIFLKNGVEDFRLWLALRRGSVTMIKGGG